MAHVIHHGVVTRALPIVLGHGSIRGFCDGQIPLHGDNHFLFQFSQHGDNKGYSM